MKLPCLCHPVPPSGNHASHWSPPVSRIPATDLLPQTGSQQPSGSTAVIGIHVDALEGQKHPDSPTDVAVFSHPALAASSSGWPTSGFPKKIARIGAHTITLCNVRTDVRHDRIRILSASAPKSLTVTSCDATVCSPTCHPNIHLYSPTEERMRKRMSLLVRAVVVGLGALALLTTPTPVAAAPLSCQLCGSTCSWAGLACMQMCGVMGATCEYTGSCQGDNGTWYPATINCTYAD